MLKKIFIGIIFLALCNAASGQDEIIPVSSAEKFNKRGIYNNGDLNFNGKEIISDYDGNLMLQYSTPLNFTNDLGGELTLIYNANVEHRYFHTNNLGEIYSINSPEWILGYKGFALQTLNFETNRFTADVTSPLSGEEVPLLINGYHFTNPSESFLIRDYITILKADGTKIVLENVKNNSVYGLYIEKGLNTYGMASVMPYDGTQRLIHYKPGDGLTYIFTEEYTNFGGSSTPFKAIYLQHIETPEGDIHLSFLYGHLPQNIYQQGRKAFMGIQADNRQSSTNGWELYINYNFNYSENIFSFFINNYNNDDFLNVKSFGFPSNLFLIDQDSNSKRMLKVNEITDKQGRTDEFSYTSVHRKFEVGNPLSTIDYSYSLINSYITDSGRKHLYTYYSQVFYPEEFPNPESIILNLSSPYHYILYNVELAERDCFTNFMLKKKEVFIRENNNYKETLNEDYNYYKEGGNGNIYASNSNGIITEKIITSRITHSSGIDTNLILSPQRIIKNFSRYGVENVFTVAFDPGSTIKLMSEEIRQLNEEGTLKEKSIYTYDIGTPDTLTFHPRTVWLGSFLTLSQLKQRFDDHGASYTTENSRTTNDLQFDSLKFFDGETYLYSLTKKILKQEKWIDSKGLVTEKKYNNFLENGSYSEINNLDVDVLGYYHKIGSIEHQHIYSGTNTKSFVKYEYYPTHQPFLDFKLKYLINNSNTTPDTTYYEYYNNPDNSLRIKGLLKKRTSGKGITEEYNYVSGLTDTYDRNLSINSEGTIVTYSGLTNTSIYSHQGFSISPFSTTIKFNNGTTLGSFITANNTKEKPDFEIDLNGFYTKYEYDGNGRLTKAILPGNYQKEIDGFDFYEYNPLTITYYDNNSGLYPLSIVEKKWLSGSKFLETQIEFDSFGRQCKTSVKNDAGSFEKKSLKEFDYLSRVVKETQGDTYTHYNYYNIVGDLLNVTNADGSVKTNTYHYGQGTIGDQTYYVQTTATDETGKTKTSYYDQVGNLVAEQFGTNNPTLFYYDSIYRLTKVKTPEGIETTYQYDQNSNIIYKHSPDFGTYRYAYDRFNRLRFQLQVESQEFVFNYYDPLDRLLYTGVINNYSESSFNTLNADNTYSFESDTNNLVVVNQYDSFVQSGVFVNSNLSQTFTYENPKGRLTASAYRDIPGQEWNYKLYSYDHLGRIKDQYLVE